MAFKAGALHVMAAPRQEVVDLVCCRQTLPVRETLGSSAIVG
jgi:hypothetical protein